MSEYRVFWSLSGRGAVEAENGEEAVEKFFTQIKDNESAILKDSDGYEIYDVELIELEEGN